MDHVSDYSSNTCAASGNQSIFSASSQETGIGRVFYKLTHSGSYRYRLCFSGILDSTFADGSVSRCNLPCPEWKLRRCRVAVFPGNILDKNFSDPAEAQWINQNLSGFQDLSFSGRAEATIHGQELLFSDPIPLTADAGDYLCVESEFQGTILPYHEESLLPVFRFGGGSWCYDKRVPLPCSVSCDRPVKAKIVFWGDSITQGIGTVPNTYRHWCALAAQQLPSEVACWNLGLGYGRASDAASGGIWMRKALQNDIVCVCFGVNDILQGSSCENLKQDLFSIVTTLKSAGKTVLLQTVPPFDYAKEILPIWHEVNRYIREELSGIVDIVLDTVPFLGLSEQTPHIAKFGGHPNEEGCVVWAQAILPKLLDALRQGGYL